jgi:drug/metabolite transporter (DMT)-like permease
VPGRHLSHGIGFVLSRRRPRTSQCDPTITAVIGLAPAPFIGGFEPVVASPSVVAGLLILGVIGTGLVYLRNTHVIAASTVICVTPVVGLGATIHRNEPAPAS